MYEVLLGSKGVMQIGWCTVKCRFSTEVDFAVFAINIFVTDLCNWSNSFKYSCR